MGLLLRSARERRGLSLDVLRDQISVPRVDLVALEAGELSLLHTERAAAVALWRFADALGLDAELLVRILHTHWPRPTQGHLTIRPFADVALPVAQIAEASKLLAPIGRVVPRDLDTRPLGLSASTQAMLASVSARKNLGYEVLGTRKALKHKKSGKGGKHKERAAIEGVDVTAPMAEIAPASATDTSVLQGEEAAEFGASGTATSELEARRSPFGEVAEAEPANEGTLEQVGGVDGDEVERADPPNEFLDSLTTVSADSVAVAAATASAQEDGSPEVTEKVTAVTPTVVSDDRGVPTTPPTATESAEEEVTQEFATENTADTDSPQRSRGHLLGRVRRSHVGDKARETDHGAAPDGEGDVVLQKLLEDIPVSEHEVLLRSAVDRLAPEERNVLRLVVWDEVAPSIAAERIGVAEADLPSLLERARANFRRELIDLAATLRPE
jgi:hypothetical protein